METPNTINVSINSSPFAGTSLLPESPVTPSEINDIEDLINKAKNNTKVTYITYFNFFFPKIFQHLLCFIFCAVHYFFPLRILRAFTLIFFGLLLILIVIFMFSHALR